MACHFLVMKANKCPLMPENTLEKYLTEIMPAQTAGAIFDSSIETVEDHLLICPICQDYAETHELLMRALRAERKANRGCVMVVGMALSYDTHSD